MDEHELKDLQWRLTKQIILYAFEHVPAYREMYKGINISNMTSMSDIHILPTIDKKIVMQNPELFISDEFQKKQLIPHNTGGSSGHPMTIYYDHNEVRCIDKAQTRWMLQAGISTPRRRAIWVGRTPLTIIEMPELWRERGERYFGQYVVLSNNLVLSSQNLSIDVIKEYVARLRWFRPQYIQGYPSAISRMAEYMITNNITIPTRAVLCSSELLLQNSREQIEKAFCCKVFDRYGLGEEVATAIECKDHNEYHIDMDQCYVEILKDNTVVFDEVGEIVGTCLTNYAMPLIRYRTGDFGKITNEQCSCGLHSQRIISLCGRMSDVLYFTDGSQQDSSTLTSIIYAEAPEFFNIIKDRFTI